MDSAPPTTNNVLRPATAEDVSFLWDCLALAAQLPDAQAARTLPGAAKYLDHWPRPGDFGVIADGQGAAWARQFSRREQPDYWIDGYTPDVAIGVLPGHRGKGLGTALLRALMAEAQCRGHGLCLNARDDNPAVRLYRRLGFHPVPGLEGTNHAGTASRAYLWHP